MKVNLPYSVKDRDRYGNVRYYVRRKGQKKVRIHFAPSDPRFLEAYNAAIDSIIPKPIPDGPRLVAAAPQTFGWLAARYFTECADYIGLVPKSRSARRACIEDCLREPLEPGGSDLLRDCPAGLIGAIHMKMLRDRKKGQPGAANNRRKHVSALMTWAVEEGLMKFNPMRDIKSVPKKVGGGYYTWTEDDVRQFVAFYPLGTKPHLALALMLYTGARRQDMVTFGKQHVKGGWLRYVPKKTLYKRSDMSQKPWLPILEQDHRGEPLRRPHLPRHRAGQAVHRGRFRQLVPRCLRQGRIAEMHRARPEESRRDLCRGSRRHDLATDGDVRLDHDQPGRGLHQGREPQTDGRRRDGTDQFADKKNSHRPLVSHCGVPLSQVIDFKMFYCRVAGVAGLEPATPGFGDRCSTN